MNNLEKIKSLSEQVITTGDTLYNKNVKKYATDTRNLLQEIVVLCKEARKEALAHKNSIPSKRVAKKQDDVVDVPAVAKKTTPKSTSNKTTSVQVASTPVTAPAPVTAPVTAPTKPKAVNNKKK